jgi:hypothetical protein
MAAVTIAPNNTRVEDAEAATGWSSRGGGAGGVAEAILTYQGTNIFNRKVTSSTGAGFEYDPVADGGSAQDMTTAALAHWMVKVIVTDAGDLRGNDGLRMIIGDGTNEYAFIVAGTDAVKNAYDQYLLRTSHIIIPVNPNISGYRDGTHSSGTVTLTAVDQFGVDAEFITGSAKAENVGVDAIDLGTGLTLTRGDGVDTNGTWQDFVDADEGTINNRWGYASSLYSAVNVMFGQLTIGDSAGTNATEFSGGINEINLWPDGLYAAGFSNVTAYLNNASDVIDDKGTHTSLGTTNVQDTRLDWTWSGTSGTGTASHKITGARNYTLTSAVTLDGADIEIVDLTQASGTIQNSIVRTNSASGVAVLDDLTIGNITDTQFIQSSTGVGHAIEITSPGTYSFSGLTFTGYGANGSNSAAIYNNSGGSVTINVSGGGNTPTYRNGTSASTTVNNNISVTFTGLKDNTEVRVYDAGDGSEIGGIENATSGSPDNRTFTWSDVASNVVDYVIHNNTYETIRVEGYTVPTSDTSIPVQQRLDRNYSNP